MKDFFTFTGVVIYTAVTVTTAFVVGFLVGIQFYEMCVR